MLIADITNYLETIAPLPYQEDYDNAGLLTGDLSWECSGVITTLDVTPEVVQEAGAGHLGKYSECSFNQEGTGTFKPEEGADPFVGEIGKRHEEKEMKIEIIFPAYLEKKIIPVMLKAHPYEEVAYDIISLGNYL